MTEEEEIIFKKDVKKVQYSFLVIFITFIIVGLLFQRCNSNKYQQLKGEYKQLNEQYLKQKDGVKVSEKNRLIEKEVLDAKIKKREIENEKLTSNNKTLEAKINSIKNRPSKVYENVTPEINDKLNEGDKCAEIIPLKDEQIANKDVEISNLEKDKVDTETKLTTAEKEIEDRKLLQEAGEKNINNLKEQVSKLDTNNDIYKYLVPASAVLGIFLGYKLAK